MEHGGVTTIWGKNGSDQIFYVSCPNTRLDTAASWSAPLPLISGIEKISTYVNHAGYSNTIFASGGKTLRRFVQATETGAKLWRQEAIILEALPTAKALAFNSYTTTIQLANDKKLPASDIGVSIATDSRTPVYINGLYYVLSPTPITVSSDKTGTLTIVENAHNTVNGTTLTVTCGGNSIVIDPSDKHFQKITALDTADSLRGAQISTNVVAGGTTGPSTTVPLVDLSASQNDLQSAAASLSSLNSVYGSIKSPNAPQPAPPPPAPRQASVPEGASASIFGDIADGFVDLAHATETFAGDLFHALKSAADSVVQIVQDAASGLWHFVTSIAGKVYHAVLDTVDAVVGAVEWVFNAIKTVVQDIIRFLEFLLDWDDITRTKNVISNVAQQFLQGQIDTIPEAKAFFDKEINSLEAMIGQWAGDKGWTTRIGQATTQPLSANGHDPASGQTSGSQMLTSHYKNNASSLTVVDTSASNDSVEDLIENLVTALENEGNILSAAYNDLKDLARNFQSMSLEAALDRLIAIVAKVFISSLGNVGDAILDLLSALAKTAMHLLNTKFHIPVISDILSELGIGEPSLLDLFCWIAAVSYTVVYKIVNNSAPFPDNDDVNALINAESWFTMQALLGQTPPPKKELSYLSQAASYFWSEPEIPPISASTRKTVYISMHGIGGLVRILGTFVTALEADGSSDDKQNPFSRPKRVLEHLDAALDCVAGVAVPQDPITSDLLKEMATMHTAMKVIGGSAVKQFAKTNCRTKLLPALDGRGMGAITNVVLGYWGLFISAGHLYELSHESADSNRTAAILIEVSSILGQMGTVAYCEAVNDPDRTTREAPILVIGVVGMIKAGLEVSLLETV